MNAIPLKSYKILEKEKYTLHTIPCLTVLTHAFCNTHVKNLLKGPDIAYIIFEFSF